MSVSKKRQHESTSCTTVSIAESAVFVLSGYSPPNGIRISLQNCKLMVVVVRPAEPRWTVGVYANTMVEMRKNTNIAIRFRSKDIHRHERCGDRREIITSGRIEKAVRNSCLRQIPCRDITHLDARQVAFSLNCASLEEMFGWCSGIARGHNTVDRLAMFRMKAHERIDEI